MPQTDRRGEFYIPRTGTHRLIECLVRSTIGIDRRRGSEIRAYRERIDRRWDHHHRGSGDVRRRLLSGAAPPLAAAGIATALLAAGGGSAGASTAPAPVYSALSSTAPSGLPLVESHASLKAGEAAGPSFPAEAPAGSTDWPLAGSIRRLSLNDLGMTAWIARASAGGVCVLLYDGAPVGGIAAVYFGCSAPGGDARGASIEVAEIPGMPGKVIAAGVAPDGVTSVSETMADGSTAASVVSGNSWARVADQPAAAGEEPTEITGG